jgi:hypothetical protein
MKPSVYHPLQLALGLAIWITWFGVVYGGLSLVCVSAPPDASLGPFTWINGLLLVVTMLVALLLLYYGWQCWRAPGHGAEEARRARVLVARVAAGLHLVAALATLAVGIPLLVLPPCV